MRKFLEIAVLAAGLALCAAPAVAAPVVGQPAPGFTAAAAGGGMQNLSDHAGKIVILEWFNKGCPFVRRHYDSGNMQSLQREMAARGAVWLTVSSSAPGKQGHETAEQALATAASWGAAPAHVLLDPDGSLGRLYGAKTTPHMFVIDASGVLAYAGAIDDRPSADEDGTAAARNHVRAAVEDLVAGRAVAAPSTAPYGCGVKYAG